MYKIILIFIALLVVAFSFAQSKKASAVDSSKKAILEVHLTNRKQQALANEEIIISSADHKKNYNVITNTQGNASVSVNVGYIYTILLKTIGDTTTYGKIEIPALAANQVYQTPFAVDMVYEPAKAYTFHHLEFDIAKATVKKDSYKELEQLVEFMQRKKEVQIEIAGHTDNAGKAEDNQTLSHQRADAVKFFLIQKGVKSERIKTIGYGASKPIADNNTVEGRQINRRTELQIL